MAKVEKIEKESESLGPSIYLLFDEITNETAKEICSWILDSNFPRGKKHDILNLIINSEGGSLYDAYAIIDIMKSSHIPIRTIGIGQIQSAALMIFMAGTVGQRILSKNTSVMSHQYSAGSGGKFHELIAIQKEFDLTYNRMLNHYKEHTKLSEGDIKKYLLPESDIHLSADEALALGICDDIAWSTE